MQLVRGLVGYEGVYWGCTIASGAFALGVAIHFQSNLGQGSWLAREFYKLNAVVYRLEFLWIYDMVHHL